MAKKETTKKAPKSAPKKAPAKKAPKKAAPKAAAPAQAGTRVVVMRRSVGSPYAGSTRVGGECEVPARVADIWVATGRAEYAPARKVSEPSETKD